MRLTFFFTLLFILFSAPAAAQEEIDISGTVLDAGSEQAVEFATVMIGDPATGKALTGTTTDAEGRFSVVADRAAVFVEITFIGFDTRRIDELQVVNGRADLGTIRINAQGQMLDEVTVRAEKSTTEFKLDKRIFNVGKDLSSTGASALEVLNNVPSVNVSIEGEIALRGSTGVQVLINGKPSVIASEQGNALGTLTADMIESIEVITNPSAKYDAEGTSGIINIVLKKEERKGLNGALSVNTGTPHNHSVGLSLNRRSEKFNLFSQLGVGYRELPNEARAVNRNLEAAMTIFSEGEEFRNEQFYNLVLGTDYYLTPRDVFTLSGNFAYEIEDQPSRTDFRFTDGSGSDVSRWRREETTEATNPKWQYEFQYKRDFKDDKDHDLLFSILGRFFGKDQSSEFQNTTLSGDDRDARQRTATNYSDNENTFKLDYTRPLNEKATLEAGAQYVTKLVKNDFSVSDFDGGDFILQPGQTNIFDWDQKVLAVYATAAYEWDRFGLKGGLRLENTDLQTLLENTGEENDRNFTNLFPSGAASYKISDAVSLQASYSRRIFRPRLWDLNPFFNIRNNFNVRTGNPDLLPEYTDGYELMSIFILGQVSLNAGIYHRYTTAVVERISFFQDNVNTTQPVNVGTNKATGLEINGKYPATKWLTLTGDLNYNLFRREGELEGQSFDFQANQYSGKLTSKLKLPQDLDLEMTGQYQSSFQTIQGTTADAWFLDFGARKKILKGKGSLAFAVRDVFATRVREREVFQPGFSAYSRRLRGRFVTLGFSYGFGKGEAMEYSGQKRRY